MYRELISWLGLFTSQKDTLSFISKRIQQQPQLPTPTPGDKSGASGVTSSNAADTDRSMAKKEREKKKDETIFGYLKGLVD